MTTVMCARVVASSLLLLACAPAMSTSASGSATGAVSPRAAVEQFLAAVRAEDVQAMSVVWGTSRGASRETMERTQLERRAIIMQCYLAHSQFRILSEVAGEGGRRVFRVEITRGSERRQPTIHTIAGPGQRWYVENVDMTALRDFGRENCGESTTDTTRSGQSSNR